MFLTIVFKEFGVSLVGEESKKLVHSDYLNEGTLNRMRLVKKDGVWIRPDAVAPPAVRTASPPPAAAPAIEAGTSLPADDIPSSMFDSPRTPPVMAFPSPPQSFPQFDQEEMIQKIVEKITESMSAQAPPPQPPVLPFNKEDLIEEIVSKVSSRVMSQISAEISSKMAATMSSQFVGGIASRLSDSVSDTVADTVSSNLSKSVKEIQADIWLEMEKLKEVIHDLSEMSKDHYYKLLEKLEDLSVRFDDLDRERISTDSKLDSMITFTLSNTSKVRETYTKLEENLNVQCFGIKEQINTLHVINDKIIELEARLPRAEPGSPPAVVYAQVDPQGKTVYGDPPKPKPADRPGPSIFSSESESE